MNEESIFAAALEKGSAAERRAFLDQACAGQPQLRAQVEELLRASDDAGSFLEHAPLGVDATIAATGVDGDTEKSATRIGLLPFLAPCDKPDRIGQLDHYEIIELVGHGGMGAVLRAFDSKLSRVVAVKVMAPELAANPTAVKRFQREATAAAAVHHDHVVTIHSVEPTHKPPYLVMQFVEGQTLQQKIDNEGALELRQILRIGSQTAAGLAAAHKHGLVHRDVKPANILLENGVERVKITDFGLARAADDLEVTKIGLIAGTPQYMSPEQARGEPIDARSDLFSLGSVLYTMCTGRPAFRAETTMGVLHRVCNDAPRPIREVNPEIPEWLEAIVNRLLAKDPDERLQTAAEVADLLGQHLAHLQQPLVCPLPEPVAGPRSVENSTEATNELYSAGNLFWATGNLSLVSFGLAVMGLILEFKRHWPDALAIWFLGGGLVSLPVGVLILWGAYRTQSGHSRGWALAAGILSLLPINPFLVFCLPVTIWTLASLHRADAPRAAREKKPSAAAAAKPLPPAHGRRRHALSLAIATLLCVLIAISLGVGAYAYREATTRPEIIAVYIDDPQVIVTIDGRLLPMSSYSGAAPSGPEGPNWVAVSAPRVRPGRHHVRALKGNQVFYDETFDLKRGEQKSIRIRSLSSADTIGADTNAAELEALRDLVAAHQRSLDTVKERFEGGAVTPQAVMAAEIELLEARIRLAEAEHSPDSVVELLTALVATLMERRALVQPLVEAGVEVPAALSDADAKVADAKARLAKARSAAGLK